MKNKILILSSEFPPGPGGIGSHAFDISCELNKRGYLVIINTISDYVSINEAVSFDRKHPFKVYRFKRFSSTFLTFFYRIKTIINTIQKFKIKTVIISGKFSIWVIPFLKLYSDIRFVTVVHGTELGKTIFLRWTLFCLNKSNKIITVSNFTRSLIPKNIRYKTYVINNGVNLKRWSNVPNDYNLKHYPILLTVGSISIRKGQFNVIKLLPYLIKEFPNTHYHCVGNHENKEQLFSLMEKLNLIDKVTIHGFLEHSKLEKIYSNSHVNMLLADNKNIFDFEGFGISVLEGNIYGLPTIGSKHTGLEDSIKNNYNGKLVDPENYMEIIESLKQIFTNYNHYSVQSKSHAKKYTWENKIDQYEKLLQ